MTVKANCCDVESSCPEHENEKESTTFYILCSRYSGSGSNGPVNLSPDRTTSHRETSGGATAKTKRNFRKRSDFAELRGRAKTEERTGVIDDEPSTTSSRLRSSRSEVDLTASACDEPYRPSSAMSYGLSSTGRENHFLSAARRWAASDYSKSSSAYSSPFSAASRRNRKFNYSRFLNYTRETFV